MHLTVIPPHAVDRAWRDGASCLAEACETSGGEIEGPQLKMILSRGERSLVAMVDDGKPVGWAVFRIDQLPNVRAFYITDLVAPNVGFENYWPQVLEMANGYGCSRVRCAAKPAQARLYRQKLGFQPVYEVLEVLT